jgi:hypothetical protein
LIARAKPHVLRDLSRVGNAARNAMLPGEHRSKIARKAARARWRKKRHPNGTMHTGRTRRRNQKLGTTSPPVR